MTSSSQPQITEEEEPNDSSKPAETVKKDKKDDDAKTAKECYKEGVKLTKLGQHEEAISFYEKAIDIEPENHRNWVNKAYSLAQLGRHEEAIHCYEKAIEIEPRDKIAWDNMGLSLAQIDRYEETLTCHEKALELDSKFSPAWHNKGLTLRRLGRHEEAITCYEKALEIEPRDALAWYRKAQSEEKAGRINEAIRSLHQFISTASPKNRNQIQTARRHLRILEAKTAQQGQAVCDVEKLTENTVEECFNKAIDLAERGRHEESIMFYTKVLEIEPRNYKAWYNKALSEDALEQWEAEAHSFKQFIATAPPEYQNEIQSIRRWLCEYYIHEGLRFGNLVQYDKALSNFNQAIIFASETPGILIQKELAEVWCHQANTLRNLSMLSEALESAEYALQIDNNFWQGWLEKGRVLANLGRYDEALVCADNALARARSPQERDNALNLKEYALYYIRHPVRTETVQSGIYKDKTADEWLSYARSCFKNRQYRKAASSYENALKINPKDTQAWIGKGKSVARLGLHLQATSCYDKAIRINPNDTRAWIGKGKSLACIGENENAFECFEKVLQIQPKNSFAWYSKAQSEESMGRYADAVLSYRRFIALAPPQGQKQIQFAKEKLRTLVKK